MDEPVSKSQKKRDADFLQKTAIQFIALSLEKLQILPLPDNLYRAIVEAKNIKSHGAKRRQAQLIGKLMRAADHESILEAYQNIVDEDKSVTASFHEIETWRDQLIAQPKESITHFVNEYPEVEIQLLRQLVKKAIDEQQKEQNSGAAKALFRFLRSTIL